MVWEHLKDQIQTDRSAGVYRSKRSAQPCVHATQRDREETVIVLKPFGSSKKYRHGSVIHGSELEIWVQRDDGNLPKARRKRLAAYFTPPHLAPGR